MAWYDEAVFYHIYPLGLLGAPQENDYAAPVHRLPGLLPWISHLKGLGCNALYIGPLFESVGHGYETTDYRKLDSRLGTNEDLKALVQECHQQGIRVIFDGVFNHTGRDFFAFQDLRKNRESSRYVGWYCNVNFWGNNEYNDGFSYDNWGGYNLLAKLNQRNPEVRDYLCDVVRFWVDEFDVDGIRLDAADVLDFDFMKALRHTADTVKPDFWLMGEVIHGDYSRWANANTLHSVTNYMLHKAFYSGHNDHNYFEIAHTLRYVSGMTGNAAGQGLRLYHFVDNHDVERISTKLQQKAHYTPVHVLLYTLPGIPSIYYGSEFGIDGRKIRGTDAPLRPSLRLSDFYGEAVEGELKDLTSTAQTVAGLDAGACMALISALGKARTEIPALCYGGYIEKQLTTEQYAFERALDDQCALVLVNNAGSDKGFHFGCRNALYKGILSGKTLRVTDGFFNYTLPPYGAEIWVSQKDEDPGDVPEDLTDSLQESLEEVPAEDLGDAPEKTEETEALEDAVEEPVPTSIGLGHVTTKQAEKPQEEEQEEEALPPVPDKPYEEMTVQELQAAILTKMAKNGPVTDQMRKQVTDNIWPDSLRNWVKSFR